MLACAPEPRGECFVRLLVLRAGKLGPRNSRGAVRLLSFARCRVQFLCLSALATETFVLYRRPTGPGLYDGIIAASHRAGFSPQVGQEAPRILSTLSLVAAGLGVSIVPESLQRLRVDGIAYRRLKASGLRAPLNLAHRRNEASTAVRRFIELVQTTARSLRGRRER